MDGYYAAPGHVDSDQGQSRSNAGDAIDPNVNHEVVPACEQSRDLYSNQNYGQPAYFGGVDQITPAPGYNQGASPDFAFNGHMIHASTRTIPDEFVRVPTGTSVAEPGSILDEESGRTYHNHNTGKYFFPNDAVSVHSPWRMDALA